MSTCALFASGCDTTSAFDSLALEDVPSADVLAVSEDAEDDAQCALDECWIDGTCFFDGELDERRPCRRCDAARDRTGWTIVDGGACEDGSLCTMGDRCVRGACAGAPVSCDDGNRCTWEACDPRFGCRYSAVDPDDGDPCTTDACEPSIGVVHRPADGVACEDGDPCTLDDQCLGGACEAGFGRLDCDDGDVCTTDRCETGLGCRTTAGRLDCDDGNACTTDSCDSRLGCVNRLSPVGECRPRIRVDEPVRAATLTGDPRRPEVRVSGRVYSAAGPIRQVLVNGREATVEHGAFVARVEAHPGGNTLVIQATDAMGTTERRVQAFHFASRYGHADRAGANAIVARASTKTLATELSAVASQQLRALDLQKVLPEVVGHGPTHEVRLSSVRHEPVQVFVTPRDGGLAVQVSVARLRIGLVAEGGSMGCLDTRLLRLCRDYPDVYGALTVSQADVSARLWISASQGRPQVRLGRVQVSLTQPRVELGGLGALGSRLGTLVLRLVRGVIEQRLASTVAELLAGPLEQALDVVTMEGTLELEPLEPDAARLRVGLSTPVQRLSVTRDRVEVVLGARTRALARKPWRGGDVLQRRECPGDAPYVPGPGMEIEVSDDLLNRIMASAWRAGLLEFEIDRRVLARARLGRFGVTDLRVEVSGMLPPVISDCNPTRTPRLHVGDLVVNAELTLWGRPVTAKLFVSFEGGLALRPGSRYLRLVLTDVEWVDGELEVDSGEGDSAAHGSPLVGGILRRAVVPLLADELTGVVLAEVPLPRATLLEGEVRLMALEAVRRPGGTVLRASVKR